MTLIDAFKTPCTLMVRTRISDGEGGHSVEWVEGETFDAAITADTTSSARVAEKSAEQGSCVIAVDRGVALPFHGVVRRDSDGATYRIVGSNAPTPDVATFQFNQYRAQEWELA